MVGISWVETTGWPKKTILEGSEIFRNWICSQDLWVVVAVSFHLERSKAEYQQELAKAARKTDPGFLHLPSDVRLPKHV